MQKPGQNLIPICIQPMDDSQANEAEAHDWLRHFDNSEIHKI